MIKTFLIELAEWLYKKKCYFCGSSKENLQMCSKCFDDIDLKDYEIDRKILNCDIYCATTYSNIVQKLIRGLKYHKKSDLAYYQAKIMFNYWKELGLNTNEIQVIPVPLYKAREKSRKYNHMNLVGEEFCKLTGYTLNKELVERIKDTLPQYKLNRKERMENLDKAFRINKTKIINKPILLIDDICTTGATFESIIEELNKNGIYDIMGFATATPNI